MASSYPRRPALVRTSVAAIEASPGELHDQQHVVPLDKSGRLYTFIPSGTDTPDSVTVLAASGGSAGVWRDVPYDDRGTALTDAAETLYVSGEQWRRLAAGTLTANRTKTLSTTQARAGHRIRITSDDASAFTLTIANGGAGGGTIATLRGPGDVSAFFDGTNWIRDGIGGSANAGPSVATQAAFYINSSTGSDSAAGTSTAPLKTLNGFFNRIRGVQLTVATSVYLTDAATTFGAENIPADIDLGDSVTLSFYGSRTSILTGTLTSVQNVVEASGTISTVTASGLPTSWASSLGSNLRCLMRVDIGGGNYALCWIASEPSAKTARVSDAINSVTYATTSLTTGAFTCYTLTPFGATVVFNIRAGRNAGVVFYDCAIGASDLHATSFYGSGSHTLATSSVVGMDVYAGAIVAMLCTKTTDGCRAHTGAKVTAFSSLLYCTSSPPQANAGSELYLSNTLVQGSQIQASTGGTVTVASGQWAAVYEPNVSAGGNGVDVQSRGTLKVAGRLFGTCQSSGSGLFVDVGGYVAYKSTKPLAITGGAQDTLIGGTAKSYATLSTAGYFDAATGAGVVGTAFTRG